MCFAPEKMCPVCGGLPCPLDLPAAPATPAPAPAVLLGQGQYARTPAPDALFVGMCWLAATVAASAAVVLWLLCR